MLLIAWDITHSATVSALLYVQRTWPLGSSEVSLHDVFLYLVSSLHDKELLYVERRLL